MLGKPIDPIVLCDGKVRAPLFGLDGRWVKNAIVNAKDPDKLLRVFEPSEQGSPKLRLFKLESIEQLSLDLRSFQTVFIYREKEIDRSLSITNPQQSTIASTT